MHTALCMDKDILEEEAASIFTVKWACTQDSPGNTRYSTNSLVFWMWISTYKTTWCHNPEDNTLKNHHCENLKTHMPAFTSGHWIHNVMTNFTLGFCFDP
jgi:hypothetical protein